MIVCTYIMNHSLSITAEARDEVLAQISLQQDDYPERPSPWMASMQLRHYFAELRTHFYTRNLTNLQQILHRSGKCQRTSAFVTVLGMAFVLEECHHTLLLQAEGKVFRGEASESEAHHGLESQCAAIDKECKFLCNLLHCKYQKGKNTQKADLCEWIATTKDAVEKAFLQTILTKSHGKCESMLDCTLVLVDCF